MADQQSNALRLAELVDRYSPAGFTNEIAAELRRLAAVEAERDRLRKHADTLTHQVICCGVAASHPDAALTTTGAYAGKWDSPQAREVRKLRAERDKLRAKVEQEGIEKDQLLASINRDREAMRQAVEALESLFSFQVDHERGPRCAAAIAALRARLEGKP